MNKIAILALMLFFGASASAQRFGYIDTQLIMEKMPEYQEAIKELDQAADNWKGEVEQKKVMVEKARKEFLAEEILYTEEMKAEKEKELVELEKELRDYQNKRFGYEGMLFIKRQELMEPIQDKIFEAVKKVAKKRKVDFLFDKASGLTMIYSNPVYNYTDYVLEALELGDSADTAQE